MHNLLELIVGYVLFCSLIGAVVSLMLVFYNVFFHPLRHYPGPKLWAATRLAWAHSLQSGTLHRRLKVFHDKYGPVVRIAPDELSYIDAQAWKDIYGTRPGHPVIEKFGGWARQEPGEPEAIVSTKEDAHRKNRRALTGAFTEHAVLEHAPLLESNVELLVNKFKDAVESGKASATVDMVQWLNFLAFDISGALSFGESFDSVKNGRAHPWVEISCSFGKGVALIASINFFKPLDKVLSLAIPKSVIRKMVYHKELARTKLHQRLAMPDSAKRNDYVGSITRYCLEKEEEVPVGELEINMIILIFAGSETTSSAMAAILTQLLRNPESLRKVEEEVRSAFKDEGDITVTSTVKLDYLHAVIQEGIRLGPPPAIEPPRITPKGGAEICGRRVPGRTIVALNQYPTYRSALNFAHPEAFIPERFTKGVEGDNLAAFEPFLVGRHRCLGQKFAWAEMRVTLARILFSFDLSPAEGKSPRDWGEQKSFIFWEKEPLRVELRLRKGTSRDDGNLLTSDEVD